ncbi:MAG: YebC/PmpR family DNA-binding transcriptional regulator [Candidatus Pacebacteria bacterium]|nr:YebC/PmpR family DNA-binding transcriptional regulator [Candidatus Paceibacterota bacterium]
MSGHSHFHNIKIKKGAEDAKRSKTFSKLSKELSVAAKDGGSDTTFNAKLRSAVEKAKSMNMPADSIDKAIKKGSGELEGFSYEEFLLEAYGPGGTAFIIEGITDNKNRTLGEIKLILTQKGGKYVNEGGIKWMFEKKGVISINAEGKDREEMEMTAIESGADDVDWDENILYLYTKPEDLENAKKSLEEKKAKIEAANLEWVPKENISVEEEVKEKNQRLFDALDENDDVQNIYTNI